MNHRIESLNEGLASFVRASKCIGSFHNAVEEVVLNSVDARGRTIEIYVDLHTCSFEVYDDGENKLD